MRLFCLILLLIFQQTVAQKSDDSLLNLIKISKVDTIKVNAYIELAWLNSRDNPEKAIEYSNLAIELSKKIDYKIGLIDAYNRLGSALHNKGENVKALEFYQKSLEIANQCNNPLKQSITFNNMANVYKYIGNFDKAIEYYKKSLEIETKLNNKEGIASEYHGLGNTYSDKGDYPLAMDYMFKSLSIREKLNNNQNLSSILMSIGSLYYSLKKLDLASTYYKKVYNIALQTNDKGRLADILGNIGTLYLEKGDIDSALIKYQESIDINKQIGDNYSLAVGYSNIAGLYFYKSDFYHALEYNQKSLELRKLVDDHEGITQSLSNFGFIYTEKKQYNKAIDYVKMAIDYSIEKNLILSLQFCEGQISSLYADINDFKNAYKHHLRFKEITDSLNSDDNIKKMTQLEMQYEFDKIQNQQAFEQEQKEISQKAELSKQKIFRNSFIIGFLLMILLAYVMFKSYRRKKKDNLLLTLQNQEIKQQKEEISSQRDEIESQRDLVIIQKDRIEEIHKEVTDSINYAKRIQEAMLPDLSSKFQIPNSKLQDEESNQYLVNSEQSSAGNSQSEIIGSQFATSNIKHQTSNIFILFKPKDVVSGDFYWATQLTTIGHDPLLIIAVADCTGHGVPGAFMSMLGISFLNEIVRRKEVTQANHVLNQLRAAIINALQQKGYFGEQKDGMDISLIVIKLQATSSKLQISSSKFKENDEQLNIRTIEHSNQKQQTSNDKQQTSNPLQAQWAGANNPMWIVRSRQSLIANNQSSIDNLIELKPDKMPIAIYERMESFTNHEITLYKDDIVYLMSDGFQDQFGGSFGKKFKSKQLKQLLLDNSNKPMSEQKEILETALVNWIGKGEQIDDITILGIKI